jgi:hypothetical protein
MYIIDSNPNVAYTKDQLQIVQPNEVQPHKKSIRPITKKLNKDVYIEKIINKRKHQNRIQYLVSWTGFDIEDSTWEPITQLIEDGHIDMINAFESC